MNVLGLREAHDIDLVVTDEVYQQLKNDPQFSEKEKHGKMILTNDLIEAATTWGVIERSWSFDDLLKESVVIEGVRYNSPEFLLRVKKSWLAQGETDEKTKKDIEILENYLKTL